MRVFLLTMLMFALGCAVGCAIAGKILDSLRAAWHLGLPIATDTYRLHFRREFALHAGLLFAAAPLAAVIGGGKWHLGVRIVLYLAVGILFACGALAESWPSLDDPMPPLQPPHDFDWEFILTAPTSLWNGILWSLGLGLLLRLHRIPRRVNA